MKGEGKECRYRYIKIINVFVESTVTTKQMDRLQRP